MSLLAKTWVPVVVVVAILLGGAAVLTLRDEFASEAIFTASGRDARSLDSTHVKRVTYEVFGPSTTIGSLSFLDSTAQSHQVDFSGLPWTFTVSTTAPAVIASLVAQGDGDRIGCRITVNGTVVDDRAVDGQHAQTSCLAKAA